jgi:phage shock protein A
MISYTLMDILKRATDIFQAKANKALDKMEKPDEMLDLSYQQMLEQITKIKRALVTIAASRKQIELQEDHLRQSMDHLTNQAKAALQTGHEDLAKEALSRKASAQAEIDSMEPQRQQLSEEEAKLSDTLKQLQQKVQAFRTQKETLKANYAAAEASSSVNEQVAGISSTFSNSGEVLQRAQDKIAAMQAHSGALDELLASGALEDVGSGGDDIQRELEALSSTSQVDSELAALKAQVPPAGAIGAESEGDVQPQPGGEEIEEAELVPDTDETKQGPDETNQDPDETKEE